MRLRHIHFWGQEFLAKLLSQIRTFLEGDQYEKECKRLSSWTKNPDAFKESWKHGLGRGRKVWGRGRKAPGMLSSPSTCLLSAGTHTQGKNFRNILKTLILRKIRQRTGVRKMCRQTHYGLRSTVGSVSQESPQLAKDFRGIFLPKTMTPAY